MLQTASQSINLLTDFQQLLQNNNGQVSVATFMDFFTSHRQHGYYCHVKSIGSDGDFITAPHITSLFGEVIGAWLVNRWHNLGRPTHVDLIELGPGHGLLLKDILSVCQLEPDLMAAMQIKCLEINPVFRKHITNHNKRQTIQFFDQFDDILEPNRVILLVANEFFDALPIHQFQYDQHQWFERKINLSAADQLNFVIDYDCNLDDFCHYHGLPNNFFPKTARDGQILEINQQALHIINRLANHIDVYKGAALICDYGYIAPGHGDTLQAIYQHQYVSLSSILAQACDITSHVDFFKLKQYVNCKTDLDIRVQTQHEFLISNGIMQRALQLKNRLLPEQLLKLDQALHRLLSPEQMGSLFKIMNLYNRDQSC